MEPQG
ncbi:hypothetical protein HaLaN_09363, partial [Haematococcus lacustris]